MNAVSFGTWQATVSYRGCILREYRWKQRVNIITLPLSTLRIDSSTANAVLKVERNHLQTNIRSEQAEQQTRAEWHTHARAELADEKSLMRRQRHVKSDKISRSLRCATLRDAPQLSRSKNVRLYFVFVAYATCQLVTRQIYRGSILGSNAGGL